MALQTFYGVCRGSWCFGSVVWCQCPLCSAPAAWLRGIMSGFFCAPAPGIMSAACLRLSALCPLLVDVGGGSLFVARVADGSRFVTARKQILTFVPR